MHLGKKPALRLVAAIASLTVIGTAVAGCTSASNAKSDTLTIWTFKKEWIPGIEAAAAAYKKKTGTDVTVKVDYFDEANGVYSSKVSAAARSKTLPDLLTAYGSQWDYVGGNLYKKLNGKLDDTLKNIPSSLVDSFVKFNSADQATCKANPDCTYGSVKVGDYYTLPQISGATGYFYANKTLLQSAGVNLDKAPSSWGDLVADIQKSHAALGDKGGVALPLKIPETGWLWLLRPMLFTQLGKNTTDALFADKSGKAWQDPKVIKALGLYDQLSPYWIPSVLQDGIEETDQAFVSGNAAWYYGGTFSLAGLAQKGMDTSKLAIFPMPVAAGGALSQLKLTPWASGPLGVSKDAKNEQGAIDFLKFYMSPDGAQAFASKVADTPAVTLPAGSSTGNPALVQATKESFGSGDDAYNEFTTYGPTCDAAKTLNNQAAVALTGLVTKQTNPEKLGSSLAELYQKAWSACG